MLGLIDGAVQRGTSTLVSLLSFQLLQATRCKEVELVGS